MEKVETSSAPGTLADRSPLVGILTGSPNDLPTVVKVRDTLTELGIPSEIVVLRPTGPPTRSSPTWTGPIRKGCRY